MTRRPTRVRGSPVGAGDRGGRWLCGWRRLAIPPARWRGPRYGLLHHAEGVWEDQGAPQMLAVSAVRGVHL